MSDPHQRGERYLVLLYHRVGERDALSFLPASLTCPAPRFLDHVAMLQRDYSVLPLEEASTALREGRSLPPRTVVLTFDDSWAENIETVAMPLATAGLPAVFFLSAGDIDRDTLHPNHLFYYLLGSVGVERFKAALSSILPARTALSDFTRPLNKIRKEVEKKLGCELATMAGAALLTRLEQLLDVTPPAGLARVLYMRSHQVRQLQSCGISVGNHTFTHRTLTTLGPAEQREELVSAQERLGALTGQPVMTVAYPYGRFDETSVEMAASTGHRCACTVLKGYNDRHTDPWRVRRIDAAPLSGEQLLETLKEHGTAA